MRAVFDHEKLDVYQTSIRFTLWAHERLERVPKAFAVHGQLDRAATSIPLNIAEGNGKFTATDRCRFFDMARGSALECAACLDVLVAKKVLPEQDVTAGKQMLGSIVAMLVGLIKATSPDRLHEEQESYGTRPDDKGAGKERRQRRAK